MALTNQFVKDPDSNLDYLVDWQYWLYSGDTISASEWFITESDLKTPIDSSAIRITKQSFATRSTTVWLSGGDSVHYLVNRITTAEGRIDDQHIQIRIQQK